MATTSSITDEPIRTTNELEFAFFCIESVAERLHQDPVKVYNACILSTFNPIKKLQKSLFSAWDFPSIKRDFIV